MISIYGLAIFPLPVLVGVGLVIAAFLSRAKPLARAALGMGGTLLALGPLSTLAWVAIGYTLWGVHPPPAATYVTGVPAQLMLAIAILCIAMSLVLQVRAHPPSE